MRNLITLKNFFHSFDPKDHARSLSTFVTIHETERSKLRRNQSKYPIWAWRSERVIDRSFESIWQLTGEWKARRGAPVATKSRFRNLIVEQVLRLNDIFNNTRVDSLGSFRRMSRIHVGHIVFHIAISVNAISRLKRTRIPQPMLGSKILHHYFPSIIPVYDDLYVHNGILNHPAYKEFMTTNNAFLLIQGPPKLNKIIEYQTYLQYCIRQICETDIVTTNRLRSVMANHLMPFFPHSLAIHKGAPLLWKMDAKIAEYCLVGAL